MRRAAVALGLALGLALAALSVPMTGAQPARAPMVMGYYVPYDATSWASLAAHPSGLDILAAQWVTLNACGELGSRDDQTLKQFAKDNGLRVEPSLFTISGALNHQVLTDDETAAHAIDQIVTYTVDEGYDGFDLDLEGVDASDRDSYTAFVAQLGAALHDQAKLLTLALPAKEREVTVGWAGAYDYAALASAADYITIMAYEYTGPWGRPGSVAPFGWVQRVASFARSQIPPDKLLLGIAFYGYDWNTSAGSARSVGYPQAVAISDRYTAAPSFDPAQRSVSFAYEAPSADRAPTVAAPPRPTHSITTRQPGPCSLEPPPATPVPTRPPQTPTGGVDQHEVWVEDSTSVAARLEIADQLGAAGVAAWRLGLEDPGVWALLTSWRAR